MRYIFTSTGKLYILLVLFLFSAVLFAQDTGKIAGKVTDDNGNPASGANVYLQGTMMGAASDANGEYVILKVPVGNYTLVVDYVGYKSQSATVSVSSGETTEQNFTLAEDMLSMSAVVVTGVSNPKSNLNSSVAITSINANAIEQIAPSSTAELLKEIPGFYVESSGGDVGNNLFARGIPSAGAYEYVQVQEDGMPVFEDGALQFANVDNFLRIDENVDRMESVRGGSGALYATNAPGGIINFISKTGGNEFRGTAKFTTSDYNMLRTDVNVGGPISENLRYNIGGFYRYDEGIRKTGYPANRGGQLKANLMYLLDNGYVKAYYKRLNDRNTFYLPIPLRNPSDPKSIPGFDANYDTYSSVNLSKLSVPLIDGGTWTRDLENGVHPIVDAIGAELSTDLGSGFSFKNSMRATDINMQYDAIFTYGPPVTAKTFADSQHISNPVYSYADNGAVITNPSSLNGNGFVTEAGFWSIDKTMNNFANKMEFDYNSDKSTTTAGYYFSSYSSLQHWNWSNLLMDVTSEARLLNLVDGDKQPTDKNYSATYNGLTSISWLIRDSEIKGVIHAFYANEEYKATNNITVDAGLRYEFADYSGYRVEEDGDHPKSLGDSTTTADDHIGNQTGRKQYWKYNADNTSWSVGANYTFDDNLASYLRISQGHRSPIEEAYFDNYGNLSAIKPTDVTQVEFGLKYRTPVIAVFANAFYMILDNIAFTDILANGQSENKFAGATNEGVEIESILKYEMLSVNATITYQMPELKDFSGRDKDGVPFNYNSNQVRRIPKVYLLVRPAVEIIPGLEIYGVAGYYGEKYADNANLIKLPAYTVFNGGASYKLGKLRFALDATNLTNTIGLTEGNPRATVAQASGEIFTARPILGRAVRFSTAVSF